MRTPLNGKKEFLLRNGETVREEVLRLIHYSVRVDSDLEASHWRRTVYRRQFSTAMDISFV